MAKFYPAFKVLAWLCRWPWEIVSVTGIVLQAQWYARKRGGRVRVLARAGGLGDVLWAAAAADVAAKQSSQDVLLFLTQPSMYEVVRLAAPGLSVIMTHLPNPHMQSLLRRGLDVLELVYETEDTAGRHMVQTYLKQLACSMVPHEYGWHFKQAHDPRAELPVACIYAGPSWTVREMPLAVWSSVVQHLRNEFGLRVLQVLPDEQPEMRIAECDGFVIGAPLAAICNLFNQSALVLTIDSIMLHLAAGTNVPLVGLFGPTLASCRLFETPRHQAVSAQVACSGCHHRHPRLHWESGCPFDIACMQQISPGMIMAAVSRVLATVDARR